ncbi:MAG: hypothetical protein JXB46_07170, partial [Candidatus Eisenbacteria bacterium]|nr:hypothetical protein [Candidatus Eisenbacteria bacterium]
TIGEGTPPLEPDRADEAPLSAEEFQGSFGEPLASTLDMGTWQPGENLMALYGRLEAEIEEATKQEDRIRERIRREIFPLVRSRNGVPNAGVYQARVSEVERAHRCVLFNGGIEACDGTSVVHDTLPITIAQIGVCLVSYSGHQGSWVHRLFRRDLRVSGMDPVQETLEVLDRRMKRSGGRSKQRDRMTELARRGIMAFAERAVLYQKSEAAWRLGHGNPAPYELITGSGSPELLERSLDLLEDFLGNHRKFIFVPSAPSDRMLLTIGNALNPLEYAIVDTLAPQIERVSAGHYRGEWLRLQERVKGLASCIGANIVVGVYRASVLAPAHMFYAHADHAHEAALIVLADSVLQEHRGFPMLIDLADSVCGATFGADSFNAMTRLAYSNSGEPFRYESERKTRS